MRATAWPIFEWVLIGLGVGYLATLRWFRPQTFPRAATHRLRRIPRARRRCRKLNPRHARYCGHCGGRLG